MELLKQDTIICTKCFDDEQILIQILLSWLTLSKHAMAQQKLITLAWITVKWVCGNSDVPSNLILELVYGRQYISLQRVLPLSLYLEMWWEFLRIVRAFLYNFQVFEGGFPHLILINSSSLSLTGFPTCFCVLACLHAPCAFSIPCWENNLKRSYGRWAKH